MLRVADVMIILKVWFVGRIRQEKWYVLMGLLFMHNASFECMVLYEKVIV
jgi:hypothetical protein